VGEGEAKEDGKARQGGQAGLITWGIKVVAPLAYRYNCCVMFINQIRDDMASMYGNVKQPGGYALEHHESIIVELRKGADKYVIKRGGSDVQVGQQIVARIARNKMAEGTGQRAVFDFFYAETDEYPFGIDVIADTINTAKRIGVLKTRSATSSWYELPDGTSHNGYKKVANYLHDHPTVMAEIREQVLRAMVNRNTAMLEVSAELVDEMARAEEEE
jgi:recombination protein RecA